MNELLLTKIDKTHLEERTRWFNHPLVYKYMNLSPSLKLEDTISWFERNSSKDNRVDLVFYEGEDLVSMTGLTNVDKDNGLAEFYIVVNPDLQRNGFGKQSVELTLNYGFQKLPIHKIYLFTNDYNKRANNLYLKSGFKLEGKLRRHMKREGELIDRYVFGILKEEWEELPYSKTPIHYK